MMSDKDGIAPLKIDEHNASRECYLGGWKIVVFGGAGDMGQLFMHWLEQCGADAQAVDVRGREGVHIGSIVELSAKTRELIGKATAVIMCTPESLIWQGLPAVAKTCVAGTLLIDTSSTKHQLMNATKDLSGDIEYLSLNPLFSPSLGFENQNVAAINIHPGERSEVFLGFLSRRGATVSTISIDEHERAMAAAQVASHAALLAYGGALQSLGYTISEHSNLSTPPQRTLLAMLARISAGSAHAYHDIQLSNRHAEEARKALKVSLSELDNALQTDITFSSLLEKIKSSFGQKLPYYLSHCERIYQQSNADHHGERSEGD